MYVDFSRVVGYNKRVIPHMKSAGLVLVAPPRPTSGKDKFPMHSNDTPEPYFPENLEDFAPWVAIHGLRAPYGICQCGQCGQETNPSTQTDTKQGYIKGQPVRFIYGHHNSANVPDVEPNPGGLCMCGCGQPAPIAKKSVSRNGIIKGKPVRYLPYHQIRARVHPTLEEKFWSNVDKRGKDACWEWQGTLYKNGYGRLDAEGTTQLAHRFSYEFHFDPIPDDLCCLHKCDRPACVNPAHLFLGTTQDNIDDKVAKKRHNYGENHPLAILTEEKVREIRRLAADGVLHKAIGPQFGISGRYVGVIVRRKIWKHI